MEVLPHEHPLKLIDLNPDNDGEELIMKQDFRCPCGRCGQEINFCHRYYYTCEQCDSLHKLCQVCKRVHAYQYLYNRCAQCDISIGLQCTKHDIQNLTIYHPSHQHPLIPIYRYIEANCDACGSVHTGNFYHCTTCFYFFANSSCLFLQKKVVNSKFRKDDFFHDTHLLTLAYSFPRDDQKAKFDPRCKVCELQFDDDLWIYKCEKCRYYVHIDCATTSKKASVNAIKVKSERKMKLKMSKVLRHLLFSKFDQENGTFAVLTFAWVDSKLSEVYLTAVSACIDHVNYQFTNNIEISTVKEWTDEQGYFYIDPRISEGINLLAKRRALQQLH